MARRGKAHNRKEGVKRTTSGRLSRSKGARQSLQEMTEREALEVVVRQRIKAGIPEHMARDQKCGTVQGWLFASGQINREQYEAAEWFLILRNQYHAAIDSPGAVYDRDDTRNPSMDPGAFEQYCNRVIQRWNDIERAVCDAVFETRDQNITGALDHILVRQLPDYSLVGPLRVGLNYIHRVRMGARRKYAA